VNDDVALYTGTIASGARTNDTAPAVSGTVSAALVAGDAVEVLRNGAPVGLATVSGTTWSFMDAGLSDATWSYTARVVDAAGNRGNAGSAYSIVVDGTARPRAGGAETTTSFDRDSRRRKLTTAPRTQLTLDSVLASGESLRIYRHRLGKPGPVQQYSQRRRVFVHRQHLARNNTYTTALTPSTLPVTSRDWRWTTRSR
jgi:hypothetical protein